MPTYSVERYEEEKLSGKRRESGALNLKRLRPKHIQVLALHLQGMKQSHIANRLGLSQPWVSNVISDPLSQEYITQFLEEQKGRLTGLFARSLDAVQEGLEAVHPTSDNPLYGTRLKAADMVFKLQGSYDEVVSSDESAEDVIERMLQVNVQVNTGPRVLTDGNDLSYQQSGSPRGCRNYLGRTGIE